MFCVIGKQVPTKLAFGMIKSELLLVVVLSALSSLVSVYKIYNPTLIASNIAYLLLVERLIQLTTLLIILENWRKKLGGKNRNIGGYFLLGLSLWVLNSSVVFSPDFFGSVFLILGTALSYLWYFGLVVIYFGGSLDEAKNFIINDKLLPFKVIGISAGIPLLWAGVFYLAYPDGRELISSMIAQGAWGIYWIISSYLTLAVYLNSNPKDLEPYLEQRLQMIALQGNINTKNNLTLALIGLLLIGANTLRSLEEIPSPSIIIESVNADHNNVIVNLDLRDEQFKFTGFVPYYFSLRGESGSVLSKNPTKILEDSSPIIFLKRKDRAKLELTFLTDRSGEGLTGLKDLYLWYKNVKLGQIVFESREGVDQSN